MFVNLKSSLDAEILSKQTLFPIEAKTQHISLHLKDEPQLGV